VEIITMGLGGILKSAVHAAENVFHKVESEVKKDVKNTVKTLEHTVEKDVKGFIGNVAHKFADNQGIIPFIPTPPPLPKPPAPPAQPPPPQSKGFFGDLFAGIGNAVSSVGNAIGSAVTSVGNAIGSAVTSVGNAIGSAVTSVGNAIGSAVDWGKKAITEVANRAVDIGRSALNFVTEGIGGLVRSTVEGAGKILSGVGSLLNPAPLLKLFSGDFSGAWEDFKGNAANGLKSIGNGLVQGLIQGPFDTLIVGLQNGISAVQTAIGVEPVGRELKDTEIAELRKVYGNTIDYSQIRIKEGNIGLNNLLSAHTVGNTIYLPEGSGGLQTLVHEAAHSWQYQNGGTDYIGASLFNQALGELSGKSRNEAYEYDNSVKEGKSWSELNPEQQAHLIENAYVQGLFDDPNAKFMLKDGTDATAYAREAIAQMRNGKGAA
jgi:hypothetical protein